MARHVAWVNQGLKRQVERLRCTHRDCNLGHCINRPLEVLGVALGQYLDQLWMTCWSGVLMVSFAQRCVRLRDNNLRRLPVREALAKVDRLRPRRQLPEFAPHGGFVAAGKSPSRR